MAGYHLRHGVVVTCVEMAHRLVEQEEVKRLRQCPDDGNALLLPYRKAAGHDVGTVVNRQLLEHAPYVGFRIVVRKTILEQHIVKSRNLGEKAQLLRQIGQRHASQLRPFLGAETTHVVAVKQYGPLIVAAVAVEKRAQRRFARARLGEHEVGQRLFKRHVPQPDVGIDDARLILFLAENLGQQIVDRYLFYHSSFSFFNVTTPNTPVGTRFIASAPAWHITIIGITNSDAEGVAKRPIVGTHGLCVRKAGIGYQGIIGRTDRASLLY